MLSTDFPSFFHGVLAKLSLKGLGWNDMTPGSGTVIKQRSHLVASFNFDICQDVVI